MPTASDFVSAYDAVAVEYATRYTSQRDRCEDRTLLQWLRQGRYLEGRVVDLGCGSGMLVGLAGLAPESYFGVDPSSGMREQARRAYPKHTFVSGMAEDLSALPDGCADSVVGLFCGFSYCDQPWRGVAEMARVLRPGGRVFIMVYQKRTLTRPYILSERCGLPLPQVPSLDALERVFAAHFELGPRRGFVLLTDRLPENAPRWLFDLVMRADLVLGRVFPESMLYSVVEAVRRG